MVERRALHPAESPTEKKPEDASRDTGWGLGDDRGSYQALVAARLDLVTDPHPNADQDILNKTVVRYLFDSSLAGDTKAEEIRMAPDDVSHPNSLRADGGHDLRLPLGPSRGIEQLADNRIRTALCHALGPHLEGRVRGPRLRHAGILRGCHM
jgi:hypothetical protein